MRRSAPPTTAHPRAPRRAGTRARAVVLDAAAKVNLVLEVLGRRPDGYHELASVLQTIDLSDRLVVEEADRTEVLVTPSDTAIEGENLVLRAIRALDEARGPGRPVRVRLDKRIPLAAGLGGGSADAAAALIGVSRLRRLRWRRGELEALATGIGMDVPFFLLGGAALATGRGERLRPVPTRQRAFVLAVPRGGCSTREVYGRVEPRMYTDGGRASAAARVLGHARPAAVAATLYNGLEAAVGPLGPAVARLRAFLIAAGALGTAMTGSGPAVIGVARSIEHARQLHARIGSGGAWQAWVVRSLGGPAVRMRAR